jgi:puromycin-sensitive aminopeptidase
VNHLFPEWNIWEQYTTDTIGMAQKLDSLRSSHPIQVPIKHAEEVEEVFDHISYAKGSTVVRMNECVLGEQKFREGLQLYLGRHKYSNTETTDLWRAWSEVSGVDINALMTSWTSKMGYPYLKVLGEEWKGTECILKLQQTWFLADGSGEKEEEIWSIPISIASSADPRHDAGSTGMSAEDIATERVFERRIAFPTGSNESEHWVKLNSGQVALLRVAHSENMLKRMLVPGIREKGLSAIDRAAVLDDQYCLAMAGLARIDYVAMLLSAYGDEDNATVWKSLHPILLALLSAMDTAVQLRNDDASAVQALEAFKRFVRTRIILPALDRFGWEPKPGESDVRKLTRGSVFGLVEEFCYDEPEIKQRCADLFRQSVNATIADPSSDSLAGDIKASVYRIALRNGGEEEYSLLMLMYRSTKTDAVRKWVTSTLGSASTKQLKLRVMEWSISGDVKLQDCFYPMTSVANSSREGVEVAWNFLKDNFDRLKSMTATANAWSMQYIIAACASRLSTNAQATEMEAFFEAHPVPTASRKISQVLEKIRVNANFAEAVSRGDLMTASFWENL